MVKDAKKLLGFIENAFGGETITLLCHKNGKVMHAAARIGDSIILTSDANDNYPEMNTMLYLYVEDVDRIYEQAIKAGAVSLREPKNEFYGDRSAGVKDAWNNQWWIATHLEDMDEEEIKRRAGEFEKNNPE